MESWTEQALGLIETRGLVGAIEAADAGVKAAPVKLLGTERTDPALVTVLFSGDVASVYTRTSGSVPLVRTSIHEPSATKNFEPSPVSSVWVRTTGWPASDAGGSFVSTTSRRSS